MGTFSGRHGGDKIYFVARASRPYLETLTRWREELLWRLYVDTYNHLTLEYADELTHFATGIIGPDDASDVVSTAVLRSFTSPSWPGVANHRAYLYRAVLNECRQLDRGQ